MVVAIVGTEVMVEGMEGTKQILSSYVHRSVAMAKIVVV